MDKFLRISKPIVLFITFAIIAIEIYALIDYSFNEGAYHFGSEVNGLRHESAWHYGGFSLATLTLLFASLFVERLLESKSRGFVLRAVLVFISVFLFVVV
ncbi:hypothetical protein A1OW_13480 [Enterovibrio norvegicus]|uniref:hypothetical protein n=1 Tax=Enterovibrio norvegicus TaxID=188144 RepID=UPI0003028444|nr:hypothetical protein [Enterovibrio norvegicus]OEE58357.1 hypothetical protein A1OS_04120 [Enterovibrio norvegicus]OEF49186.1 hypothetical protein A1OW_13480 [Enterovibrio norvegicus]